MCIWLVSEEDPPQPLLLELRPSESSLTMEKQETMLEFSLDQWLRSRWREECVWSNQDLWMSEETSRLKYMYWSQKKEVEPSLSEEDTSLSASLGNITNSHNFYRTGDISVDITLPDKV